VTAFFALLQLLLKLAVEYLMLKNQSYRQDYIEAKDSKINNLSAAREKLRAKSDYKSQEEADKLMADILDEKKKLAIFLGKLDSPLTEDKKDASVEALKK